MRKSSCFFLCVLLAVLWPSLGALAGAQNNAQTTGRPIQPLAKELDAIFNRGEYNAKKVQFAWQNDGEIYTVLEPSSKHKGTDIVGYDTSSGKRTVTRIGSPRRYAAWRSRWRSIRPSQLRAR